jgi:hypothetical protein
MGHWPHPKGREKKSVRSIRRNGNSLRDTCLHFTCSLSCFCDSHIFRLVGTHLTIKQIAIIGSCFRFKCSSSNPNPYTIRTNSLENMSSHCRTNQVRGDQRQRPFTSSSGSCLISLTAQVQILSATYT